LIENKHLFNALDEDGKSSATYHVAEMVAYLGLPPMEYVKRSEITRKVFDDEGVCEMLLSLRRRVADLQQVAGKALEEQSYRLSRWRIHCLLLMVIANACS
jgi:hypothetical protein